MSTSTVLDRTRLEIPEKPLGEGEWCRIAVYVNEVAVIAHLRLRRKPEEAKESLRIHMRRLRNLVWDRGHLRPIVGALEVRPEYRDEVERWVGDQDWHRGEFVLFVTSDNEVDATLIDLLAQHPEPWESEVVVRRRTAAEVLRELRELPQGASNSLAEHIERATATYREVVRDKNAEGAQLSELNEEERTKMEAKLLEWYSKIEESAMEAFQRAGGAK